MINCAFFKVEFTAEENKPNVILDGCKAKRAESKTVFEVVFIFKDTPVIVHYQNHATGENHAINILRC